MKKPKKPTVAKLKRELDSVFSNYIRQRDDYTCFTCGKKGQAGQIQNGHYVSRSYNSLRYSELNCNAQCVGCNIFKRGAMDVYAVRLRGKYGENILENLASEKRRIKQFTTKELQELINTYRQKLADLINLQ